MMKKSLFKIVLIAPSMILTSCGYGLKEVYDGIPYNSPNYVDNYYNVWDSRINPYAQNHKITVTKENHELDDEKDYVFTSIKDPNFRECDSDWNSYEYTYDKDEPDNGNKAYGPAVCMTKLDDSFKYGVVSKMFDGQMFCNGDFQKSRTQVEPMERGATKGFGVLFSKECNDATYMMLNLKCSVVREDNQNLTMPGGIFSDLKMHIGLYLRNDIGYTYIPISYLLEDVPTNSGDDHSVPPYSGRNHMYVCFGFNLKNIETNRLIGFSLQYEKVSDNYSEAHPTEETMHSIMLYEVSFPKTTWH